MDKMDKNTIKIRRVINGFVVDGGDTEGGQFISFVTDVRVAKTPKDLADQIYDWAENGDATP